MLFTINVFTGETRYQGSCNFADSGWWTQPRPSLQYGWYWVIVRPD